MNDPFAAIVRDRLAVAADPTRAAGQQAYMKSVLPFYGLRLPDVRRIVKDVATEHGPFEREPLIATVTELVEHPNAREDWYAAVALLRHRGNARFVTPAALSLYASIVQATRWWDVVDEVATQLVGAVLAADRVAAEPTIRRWAVDEDLWLRRTAILSQERHRDETDTALLTDVIDANLSDPDFFIRKAIGWVLRSYARTDPHWVRTFVDSRRDRLSPLSIREALKHLG